MASSFVGKFDVLRSAPELADERRKLDRWLARRPTLAFIAEMDDLACPRAPRSGTYACPMHPEITSMEPGRCPTCGMKLLPAAPMQDGGGVHDHHGDHGQDTADGVEWEDHIADVNRTTTTANTR